MKYWEKYDRSIQIDFDTLGQVEQLALKALMTEGELRYRDSLLEKLRLLNETLRGSGSEGEKPQITIDALIQIVEDEDE